MAGHAPVAPLAPRPLRRPGAPRLRHRVPAARPVRRDRRGVDPRDAARARQPELPRHHLAHGVALGRHDGPLPPPGDADRLRHGPRATTVAGRAPPRRHRPVLDELPRPDLRVEGAPPPRGADQARSRDGRARLRGDAAPLRTGGDPPRPRLHRAAVRDPADLRRRREVRLPARRGGPRPRRLALPVVPAGLPPRDQPRPPDGHARHPHPRARDLRRSPTSSAAPRAR